MNNQAVFEIDEFKSLKSITQVANELGVEAHILRFWESKFPQIKPIKSRGKRRLYSESDVRKIKEIKTLLYDNGFTIKGAKQHLNKEQAGDKDKQKIIQELKSLRKDLASLLY